MSKAITRSFCLALFVLGLALAATSCGGPDCASSDTVTVLDEWNGVSLVYRVTGMQDKMEFFEVYRGKPQFDTCGSARTPAIATEPYQRSQGLLKKLDFRDGRLEIVYTSDPSQSIKPGDARLPR